MQQKKILQATDHGNPPLHSEDDDNSLFTIDIKPYNFKDPKITYPEDDNHLFLLSTVMLNVKKKRNF